MLTSVDIQNMSEEERARHLAEFDAALAASTERRAQEAEQLKATNEQLRAHLARRREFAQWLEQLVEQAEREDALLREEKEKILATV